MEDPPLEGEYPVWVNPPEEEEGLHFTSNKPMKGDVGAETPKRPCGRRWHREGVLPFRRPLEGLPPEEMRGLPQRRCDNGS